MMNRLARSETDRIVSGVCAGLAKYIAVDVTWVRLAFVLLSLASGLGFFIYLLLALLMPAEQDSHLSSGEVLGRNIDDLGRTAGRLVNQVRQAASESRATAVLLILVGAFLLVTQFGWLTGRGFWAALLFGGGLYLLYRYRSG